MQLAAHAKPRLQPGFKSSTSNPGLACDWRWLPACLLPTANWLNELREFEVAGLSWIHNSMMNRRLISLVYESTVLPNDAHTRCFYSVLEVVFGLHRSLN
ncbi:hypothetical protein ACN38_g8073 [Penicillium nordicum]|uniref:Uncharacterized protein n=1 Tax=Penicillium nordicum TaxID=229535 RepID=A0A0M8P4B6_9EURO|nr:hypothetical protein ACN38_g8073 [Penicillium nordicum]